MKDKKLFKNAKYVNTSKPGEIIEFDLMEIKKGEFINVGIDYFSRYVFAKKLNSKKTHEVLKSINDIYTKFMFEELIADNGRELSKNKLKAWAGDNNVKVTFTVPYYHQRALSMHFYPNLVSV
ncbi:hypothetical protein DMUE_1088 [Dictyocoela muelleri]|nr:hypothetical protein DMUE_1088 [Dictyocoela muelleri]